MKLEAADLLWFIVWTAITVVLLVLFFWWQHHYFKVQSLKELDQEDRELERAARAEIDAVLEAHGKM